MALFAKWLTDNIGTTGKPITSAKADANFMGFYIKNTNATAGSTTRGIYMRLYLAGAGAGGESARFYTDIQGVACDTAHGAHISLGTGESTTGGSITGLGVAVRGTLGLYSGALAASGTYAAIQPEIYSFGSGSDPSAVTELSFIRAVNGGNATGMGKVDDKAYLFVLSGFTSGAAKVWYDHQGTAPGSIEEWVKVKTPGGDRWLPLYNAVV